MSCPPPFHVTQDKVCSCLSPGLSRAFPVVLSTTLGGFVCFGPCGGSSKLNALTDPQESDLFLFTFRKRREAKHREQQIRPHRTPLERLSLSRGGCWLPSCRGGPGSEGESRSQPHSFRPTRAHHGLHSLAGRLT